MIFAPFLDRTDGNLYLAALHSLSQLYGKERGLILLEDVQMRLEPTLGGNAACWRLPGSSVDYCVFPVKDEASEKIAALRTWLTE